MENLGTFDQLFYKANQYQVMSLIMGGASILAPARKGGRLNAQVIADHLAARLGEIPLLRAKFIQDPLRLGTVKKLPNPDFDIAKHVTVVSLAKPGNYEQLSARLGELSAQPLELECLWRWTVIGGLKGGKLAIFCKIHHALADGIGITQVLSSIYDPEPVKPEKPRPRVPSFEEEPSAASLLGGAVVESLRRLWVKTPRFLMKNTGPVLSSLGSGARELWENRNDPNGGFVMPEMNPTSLNTSEFSGRRAVSWKTLSLAEVKRTAKRFSCTVNDVGLLLYSYAMQHYFEQTGESIDFDLWCGMPMSTRTSAHGEGGNQVTVGRICLHNTIENPLERLRAINVDSLEVKQAARPEEPLLDMEEVADLMVPLVMDGMFFVAGKLNLMGRAGDSFAPANGIFSNVPGPPKPVCVANAVMEESIPMIPAVDILAVSGGITSVADALTIGFHCDGGVVEQPDLFVKGIERGLKALQDAGVEQ